GGLEILRKFSSESWFSHASTSSAVAARSSASLSTCRTMNPPSLAARARTRYAQIASPICLRELLSAKTASGSWLGITEWVVRRKRGYEDLHPPSVQARRTDGRALRRGSQGSSRCEAGEARPAEYARAPSTTPYRGLDQPFRPAFAG